MSEPAPPPPRGSRQVKGPPPDPELVARLATIGQRFAARLVDLLVIGVPVILLILLTSDIDQNAEPPVDTPLWAQLVATAASALYEVVLIHTRGQTIGKQALKIRVERITDGRPPDWTASIMRYLLPVLPALVPVPGVWLLSPLIYLVAILHPLRQGWHDRAAGTVVVRTDAPVDAAAEREPDPPLPPPLDE